MPRKKKRMPIPLQIHCLKRIFQKANTNLNDPHAEMDEIDWEAYLDTTLSFPENLHLFKQNFPQYNWRILRTRESNPGKQYRWQQELGRKRNSFIYKIKVPIKPHNVRAKNKSYLRGRIQVTVDPKWIGRKATIIVRIPLHNRGLDSDKSEKKRHEESYYRK